MYKILIVDDEKLDREGLQEQIDWNHFGINKVETAKNAYDALRVMETYHPDILITDVKMSGMNGIQLAEQVIKAMPQVKIIFVSGYDDFVYAKSALSIGAFEYILKPVQTEELVKTIERITTIMNEELQEMEQKKKLIQIADSSRDIVNRKLIQDLLYGTYEKNEFEKQQFLLPMINHDSFYQVTLIESDEVYDTFYLTMIKNPQEFADLEMIQLKEKSFVLLFISKNNEDKGTFYKNIINYTNRIYKKISEISIKKTSFFVGYAVDNLDDIYQSYNFCTEMRNQNQLIEETGVITKLTLSKDNRVERKIFYDIDKELVLCVHNLDMDRMLHLIDYLFDTIKSNNLYDVLYVKEVCINIISRLQLTLNEMNVTEEEIFGNDVVLWNKLVRFDTIVDIRQWMKNVFQAVIDYLLEIKDKGNRKIVEYVKTFIQENYEREISLKELAEHLHYSPNHLGLIIKKELGKGFYEYLIEVRMRKAAEFLKDPSIKVYEVAQMVGYKNVTAFVNKFKEAYQTTPKEYREKC